MTSEQKLWWLRLSEKIIVAVILVIVCAGVWLLIFNPENNQSFMQWGVLALGVLLLILLYIQNVVDRYVEETIMIASQSDDERFRSLYDQSPIANVTVDPGGKILMYNPAAVKLFRSTTDALQGQQFNDFIVAYTGHDASVLVSKIRGGITLTDEELSLKITNGDEIWVLMSTYADKLHNHRIISMIDITQSKKIDTAKSEFVALATHQLRTPIAAIRWNFELLNKKLPEESKAIVPQYLDKVSRNITRMIALIDDFLSVSKLEMGTFAAAEDHINLTEYFDGILDEFAEKITQKQLAVTRDEQPPNQMFVSDSRLFHIIVSNLVSNAVKYLKPNGKLNLSYMVQGGKLYISVADDGIGIPQKDQEQLFKKFFRASNARLHQTEGTGLGLYIVKQSAEELGGTIEVASTEDVGTTFRVTLPLNR